MNRPTTLEPRLLHTVAYERCFDACPLQAGMVSMHRATTLHSSGPDTTEEPRVAWILRFRDPGPLWSPARSDGSSGGSGARYSAERVGRASAEGERQTADDRQSGRRAG